jgi:bifunctional non-homologous end joining protein LigD
MRVLAEITDSRLRLYSRTGRDVTDGYPELESIAGVLKDALLDGEIIALRAGMPSFEALAERMHVNDRTRATELAERQPVSVMAFDLLRLYGVDLVSRPWTERRTSLDRLELPEAGWGRSPVYPDGVALLAATLEQGLEGVVAKRRSSSYQPGRRSRDWIKTANRRHQSCLVGGWRQQLGTSAERIGGLLVGVPAPAAGGHTELRYAGRVGSGITAAVERELRRLLGPLRRADPPFADQVPAIDADGAVWCEPQVVVEVRHLTWTSVGRMRQPVFRGLRPDVPATEVRRES